jgi:hypothetical protein
MKLSQVKKHCVVYDFKYNKTPNYTRKNEIHIRKFLYLVEWLTWTFFLEIIVLSNMNSYTKNQSIFSYLNRLKTAESILINNSYIKN